jgi:hypothetical protein
MGHVPLRRFPAPSQPLSGRGLHEAIENALVQVSLEDHPHLVNDLMAALGRLVIDRDTDTATNLTTSERRRVESVAEASDKLLRLLFAGGGDLFLKTEREHRQTDLLVYGHEVTPNQLLGSLLDIKKAAARMLRSRRGTGRHRRRDVHLDAFIGRVATVLRNCGEPVTTTEGGLSQVVRVLLTHADEPIPGDMKRRLMRVLKKSEAPQVL